jgi:uncharacterized protein (TIRG00374 family)
MVRHTTSNDWKLLNPETANRRTTWLVRLIASGAVSAFVVAILLKQLPGSQDERTPAVFDVLRHVVWPWIGVYLVCQIGQTLLRAIRYGVLLRAAGERDVPNLFHLTLVTMTRNMFVDLVPARAGELIYIGLLNRGYKLSGQSCLSSLAISFVFDFIALGFVFLGLLAAHLLRAAWNPLIAVAAALFLIVPFGVLYALYAAPRPLLKFAKRIAGEKPSRWLEKIIAFGERVTDAMETTRRSGSFGKTLVLSVGVRLFKYIGLFGAFRAVTINSFPEMSGASMLNVLIALLTSEAAASLPLPSFMSFGTYEAGGVAAWKLLGFAPATAAIATLSFHICSQIVDYSLGGLGLLLFTLVGGRSMERRRLAAAAEAKGRRAAVPPFLKIAAACLIALACAALAAWQFHKFQKLGSLKPPKIGRAIKNAPNVADALKPVLGGRSGFIVWSSNRAGNHDIWKMDLQTGKLRQLTRDPHVDYFPRISPDGKRIVFARSRETWVPQRNETPWDAWILDLDSDREAKIAEFANAPTWLDNDTICFQRRGTQVVSRVVSSGAEEVLVEAGHGEILPGALLETPSYNPASRQLVTTIRGAARTTALIDERNHARLVDDGCQIHWTPDGRNLLDVNHGKMHTGFWLIDPQNMKPTLLFDSPTEWSHEYFPKLSPDSKFLVYGASTGAHEHDSADYEIFLWKVGSPMESAVRLTYHTGNDCWPDVWLEK